MTANPSETTMQKWKCTKWPRQSQNRTRYWFSKRSIRFSTSGTIRPPSASIYIQHSAHIPPGGDGLFNLIRSTPATPKYEPGVIVAENDYVIVHGRFSGAGRRRNWIAADVVRVNDGVLAEHWDVLQDEATEAESQSGLPMFGTRFPG
jgi:predicted SnoaL-like aldol condensation-catalyzing enzyme